MIIQILLEAQETETAESYKQHSHINIPVIETKINTNAISHNIFIYSHMFWPIMSIVIYILIQKY